MTKETYFDGENELEVVKSNNVIGYFLNSKQHRRDGPAYIFYHENGNIRNEEHRIDGKIHRLDGPARIWYDENGDIKKEEYRVNGTEIDTEQFPNINFDVWPLSLEDQLLLKMSL